MNCTLEFLTKGGDKKINNKYYHGDFKFHNNTAEFNGSPFKMGKYKLYKLEEARLLKIAGYHMNTMIFIGKMEGKKCQWRVHP